MSARLADLTMLLQEVGLVPAGVPNWLPAPAAPFYTIDKYVSGVTDGGTITLRELAARSSGNADYVGEAFIEDFEADPNKIFSLDELNSYALGKPANFAPGTRRIYTNANTSVLGAVVEKVTGKPFKDVLAERILAPLGLKNTHYLTDASAWPEPHAIGYEPVDGVLTPQPLNLSIYGPAGSMVSNLDDELVWAEALATGSLLNPAMQIERLKGAPLKQGPPYDRYALGIGETGGWWGHNGEGFGFTAAVFHNDSTGATVVVFINEAQVVPKGHPADQYVPPRRRDPEGFLRRAYCGFGLGWGLGAGAGGAAAGFAFWLNASSLAPSAAKSAASPDFISVRVWRKLASSSDMRLPKSTSAGA